MILEGNAGPELLTDGAEAPLRLGRTAEQVVQDLHGRYFEQCFRGNVFNAANQAAQAISVALATTYTGLLLYNPIGSKVNLVPNKMKFALSVAPAAIASIGLIAGYSATGGVTTQTTALTGSSGIIGSPKATGIPLSAATIVTPTWLAHLVDGFTAAALPAPSAPWDADGIFVIPPGGFIGFGALTAVTGLGFMSWEEVPLASSAI